MTRRTETASEAGRFGRACMTWRSPSSSRGRHVNAAGVWRRWRGLSREVSVGVVGCPSSPLGLFVGWEATVAVVRLLLTVEKSAEAVVPAGVVVVAGKGRTRSRARGRSCS
jgi:hypothetical protein